MVTSGSVEIGNRSLLRALIAIGAKATRDAVYCIGAPRHLRCPDFEPKITLFAHSHSASQFLRHLPSHWKSNMLPPHCGHTKLMIDEIMLVLDSPGSVSKPVMRALLFKDCWMMRGAQRPRTPERAAQAIRAGSAFRTRWSRRPSTCITCPLPTVREHAQCQKANTE